jgi:hypothetical protein
MSNHDNASKEGTTPQCRCCLIRRAESRVSPALEEGEHGQCHDDAHGEETTPADIAIVSFKQGFLPGTSISPEIHRKGAIFSHPWLHH